VIALLDRLPWIPLAGIAVLMALAPFGETPHLVEKLRMLAAGTLGRPIDVFDLLLHSFPVLLLAAKAAAHFARRPAG
jgi:hypothetical protein